jgi:hypothetical protein
MTQTTPTIDASSQTDLVARPAKYYRWTRYIVVAGLIGFGIACIRDGFYEYPRRHQAYTDAINHGRKPDTADQSHLNIVLNQALGVTLPALGVVGLAWFLYSSRGEYRLSGDVLHVPGHPPVPLDAIRSLDKTRWDRKGIAMVEYELPGKATGAKTIKLDDFVYERAPTDAIVERIERYLAPHATESPVDAHGH